MLNERCKTCMVLLSLSIVCASVNLTKAVHIDDAVDLEKVRAILEDPLHPMSAEINWGNTTAPIFSTSQPHLFYYLMALVMLIFGESELALHVLMAFMTTIAILFFYFLAKLLVRRYALFLTALFVLGPVFLPGQNLMVDVPLVALWIIFFWALFSASERRSTTRYLISATAIAVACLFKYTSLVLLLIFLFTLVLRRQWRYIWLLTIPLAALAGWSLFNYLDYGGIHILTRKFKALSVTNLTIRSAEWIAGLGAVAPFSVIFLSPANRKRLGGWLLAGSFLAGAVIFFISYSHTKFPLRFAILWALFFGNGIFILGIAYRGLISDVILSWRKNDKLRLDCNAILVLWLAGAFSFIVLFAPFMAVRHILLAVPALLLLLGYNFEQSIERRWGLFAILLTASLGILLAISDYHYANVYRQYAPKIAKELPSDANIWYAGHWGWQWYAEKEGMLQYDTKRTVFRKGDYLVVPSVVDKQKIPPQHLKVLKRVRKIPVKATPATWLRTMAKRPWGGYYSFSFPRNRLPWRFSRAPLDTFSIFMVVESDDR